MLHMCLLCRKASHVCSYINVRAEITKFLEVIENIEQLQRKLNKVGLKALFRN